MFEEALKESWLYQEGFAKGKRDLIESFLSRHFPREAFPPLDGLSAEDMDRLALPLGMAQTAEAARAAIQAAPPART